MKNLVLGMMVHDKFVNHPQMDVFIKSSKVVDADIHLFCAHLSRETQNMLISEGFYLTDITSQMTDIASIRSRLYYDFLCNHPEYDNVLLTDTRDVVFQYNPFDTPHNNQAWLFAEGIKYGVEGFAPRDHIAVQRILGLQYDLTDTDVINSSIQYGPASLIKKYVLLVATTLAISHASKRGCTDQGITNFLYHTALIQDKDYILQTPNINHFCAHGVCLELSTLPPIPNYDTVFENGLLVNPYTNMPYTMMHQWTRRDFWPKLLKHYQDM